MDDNIMQFANRTEFRAWLEENCQTASGIWLLFGKAGGPETLTAGEALEEALCFGWIDGQMQRIDDKSYKKYFPHAGQTANGQKKNKALVQKLEAQGIMTDYGRIKIAQARENGQWNARKPPEITEEQIALVSGLLSRFEPAHTNFMAMLLLLKRPIHVPGWMPKQMPAVKKDWPGWLNG